MNSFIVVIEKFGETTSWCISRNRAAATSGGIAGLRATYEPISRTGRPSARSRCTRCSYTSVTNDFDCTIGLASNAVVMPHDGAASSVWLIASITASSVNMPSAVAIGSHDSGSQHVPDGNPSGSRGQYPDGGLGSWLCAPMPASSNAAVFAQPSCTS